MPADGLQLTPARRVLIAATACIVAALLAGPAARLPALMIILLVAPGYLVERALPPPGPHPLERLALWVGLSLALIALLYQWLWLFGIALSDAGLTLLVAGVALAAVARAWQEHGARPPDAAPAGTTTVYWVLMALICGLTLWTRFEQISALALPAWVDSVHHALMVRVATETGMAPSSLEPYMPVRELPYHWGYHVFTASLVRLSQLALPETMLWSGQILNALHAPLAGALAITLWRRPWAALGAAAVAGLISFMPAYYVSWGRYTQLTGLLLLPGLAWAWQRGMDGCRGGWMQAALLLAGLSLIHVRVLIFGLGMLAAMSLVRAVRPGRPQLWAAILGATAAGAAALALTAPWLAMLLRRALLPAMARPASLVLDGGYNAINLGILWVGHNPWLAALALLALLGGLRRRATAAAVLPLWVALLLVPANPGLLGYVLPLFGLPLALYGARERRWPALALGVAALAAGPLLFRAPSTWLINNDAVIISLFLPISVAIGGGAASFVTWVQHRAPARLRPAIGPAAATLTAVLAIWGASQLRSVVNESTVLATPADRAAVEWVAANTPGDARFLINATHWLGAADRATDGGWWLLPLAGRWTSTPPVLFTYGPPEYVRATIERSEALEAYRPGDEQTIRDLIARDGIDYLYFGPKPGPLRPEVFTSLPGFTTVYSHDGVTILAVGSQS